MNGDATQPRSTEDLHPDAGSRHHGQTLARDVGTVVGSIIVVGGSWWLLPEMVDMSDSYVPAALIFMTVGLAAIFGASMSAVRGFVASAALAAVVVGGGLLTADVPTTDYSGLGAFGLWLFSLATLIVLSLAWLAGVVVGWAWRRVAGRRVLRG